MSDGGNRRGTAEPDRQLVDHAEAISAEGGSLLKHDPTGEGLTTLARECKGPNGGKKIADGQIAPWYSLGHDKEELVQPTDQLDDFRVALIRHFAGTTGDVKIRLRGDRSLPIETITGLISELRQLQARLNRDRPAGTAPVKLDLLGEVSEGQ